MSENFEQQVKHILDEIQLEPHAEVWRNVKDVIQQKPKRRFVFWWILPVVLAGGGLIYWLTNNETPDQAVIPSSPVEYGTTSQQTMTLPSEPDPSLDQKELQVDKTTVGITNVVQQRSFSKPTISDRRNADTKSDKNQTSSELKVARQTEQKPNDTELSPVTVVTNNIGVKKDTAVATTTKKPSVTIRSNDTSHPVVSASLDKSNMKRSKWSFGITADLGSSIASDSKWFRFGENDIVTSGFSSPSSPASSVGPVTKERVTSGGRLSFGVYLTADRRLNNTFSLQSSLGYRRQSLSVTNTTLKDTVISGTAYTRVMARRSSEYRFSFINLYTGMNVDLARMNDLKLGIAAGVDNQLMLSADHARRNTSLNNTLASDEKMNSLNSYHTWQPLVRFQLSLSFNSGNTRWLRISPYVNYGLRSFEKQSTGSKDRLAAFGITSTYFFR